MNRINKIAKIVKNFSISILSIPILSIGMLVTTPTPSQAINFFGCKIRLTRIFGFSLEKRGLTLDPENIQSFNYNVSFNPEELVLDEISYSAPYTQTTLPDFSQLSSGLIQGIAGSTSTPVAGEADLFTVIFTLLVENPQSTVNFFAGPEGFIVTRDPDTGETTTLSPSECPTCSSALNVPEPVTLFGSAIGLGFGTLLKKEYSKKQKKAKTLEKLKV
jgi:hypothetical protein